MDKRNKYWNLTINGEYDINELKQYIENTQDCNYYMIEHTDSEHKHIHLVIAYKNQLSFSSIQKRYIPYKPHIEPCMSINKSVQYLLHMNDKSKEQYKDTQIITNNYKLMYDFLYREEQVYIDDERTLFQDINDGIYPSLWHLVQSGNYSMLFLQRRLGILKELFNANLIMRTSIARDRERELGELPMASEQAEELDTETGLPF